MDATILAARIDALNRNLEPAGAPDDWPRTFSNAHVNRSIWNELTREMTRERSVQSSRLETIRKELAKATTTAKLRKLWAEYGAVYEASQSIFRESREILGGLAFREKELLLDAQLCQFAEEIVLDCNRMVGTPASLPLPGHAAVTRTLARVVRMRLPEWNLWTLPLVAHEYGRVVIDQLGSLVEFTDREAARFAAGRPEWKAALAADADPAPILEAAGPLLESLVADAFAAYTMGPAYGFAAITLALNPADAGYPPDTLRGEVILAVLERMGENGSKPFEDHARYLRSEWEALLSQVGRRRVKRPQLAEAIADAVVHDHALARLRYQVRVEEDYEVLGRTGVHGWRTARAWAEDWVDDRKSARPLGVPDVSGASRLHDVLNAAWLARIEVSADGSATSLSPEDGGEQSAVRQIERTALELCRRVIAAHEPPRRQSVQPLKVPHGDPR